MPSLVSALVRASKAGTFTDQPANTNTITLAGKAYTVQTSLTDQDGNVKIGGTVEETVDNLVAAINLGVTPNYWDVGGVLEAPFSAGAGTVYAAAMTVNAHVYAKKTAADTLTIYAKVPGVSGNLIVIAETLTNFTFAGAATALSGGSGSIHVALNEIIQYGQPNSDVEVTLRETFNEFR